MSKDSAASGSDARAAVVDWLLGEARMLPEVPDVLDAFCVRMAEEGVPLVRCALGLRVLHPLFRMMTVYWRHGRGIVEVVEREHGSENTPEYRSSPVAAIIDAGAEAMRFPLERMAEPWPFPVLDDLKAQNITDYAIMALAFSNGRRNMLSVATDRPGGFSTADLALIDGVLPALAAVLELKSVRRLAATVLDTYVGRRTGARILSGDIRRGTGAGLNAVLWYCDLRGFTALADRLPREELIALLNGYFEIMGGAIEARDGEILKFVGDAVLAVFPLPDGPCAADCEAATCARALDAAEEALAGMARLNAERAAWGQPTLRYGLALHVGDVMYGNIGAPNRLDFTVIGPAVNLVSRIEGLCARLDRPVLTSEAFARHCPERLASLGWQPVKGLVEPIQVFGLKA